MSDECIEWQGCIGNHGYGLRTYKGKQLLAHRVAMIEAGLDVTGKEVLHSCDNRRCVNLAHLRAGSRSDNMIDMAQRSPRNGIKLKLTPANVLEIVLLLAEGHTGASIARKYGVSKYAVYHIKTGHAWSHVTGVTKCPLI